MMRATPIPAASFIVDPLTLHFFQLGVLASLLVMLAGAGVGFSITLQREAYMGHGLGQAMLAGVAIGALYDLPVSIAAIIGSIIAAGTIKLMSRLTLVSADTAIAVVSSTAFATGVAVVSANRERGTNITNILFGNVLGVSPSDIATITVAALSSWMFAWSSARRYIATAASRRVAVAHGIPVARLEILRTATVAVVVATSVQVVGVSLAVVSLVFPAAIASAVSRTVAGIHAVAAASAALIAVVGMYISYWFDLASGPAIVLTATATWVLATIGARVFRPAA